MTQALRTLAGVIASVAVVSVPTILEALIDAVLIR